MTAEFPGDADDFENVEATEESQDLGISEDGFSQLVVAPTDWTVETIYSLIGKQIDLDPEFQRRSVWTARSKSKFIESLFLGIPIPQIMLVEKKEKRNTFIVLDGKQRLLTIKEFIDGKYSNGRKFKLNGMRILKDLDGKDWAEISEKTEWGDAFSSFTLRTAVIRNCQDERVLYEMFYRLNSGSVKLSPMELRMSLHPGNFLRFIIDWTESSDSLHRLLGKKGPDARMNDVELAVRYLGFSTDEIPYAGDLRDFLDRVCVYYNKLMADNDNVGNGLEFGEITPRLDAMNQAIDAGLQIMGSDFCRKFSENSYENRFNRAVFDVQVAALANEAVRNAALAEPERFRSAFEKVSVRAEFNKAVEVTTKTAEATLIRFSEFAESIYKEFGLRVRIPNIQLPVR